MAFVGVEFVSDNTEDSRKEVAIVNLCWFTCEKKKVYWPPVQSQIKYDKLLKQGVEPTEDWSLYQVKKIYFETDDFNKAQHKLKLCQYLSDVASDAEPELDIQCKRQRNKPHKYISDSSDEDNVQPPSKLKAPPSLRNMIKNYNKVQSDKVLANNDSKICNNSVTKSQVGCSNSKQFTEDNSLSALNHKTATSQIDRNKDLSDFSNTLAYIKRQSTDIYNQNDQILQILRTLDVSNVTAKPKEPNLPCTLPLTNLEDVARMEKYLQKEENISTLTSYLSMTGGRGDLTSITNNILRRLLTDKIASFYSFFGKRQEKKCFVDLKLKEVIIISVQKSLPGSTQYEIENCIKVWLKHAPQRSFIKENKANNK